MDEATTWAAIGLMALVTALVRLAGPLIMRYVPLSPRVERFLEAMSVSVMAAIVASFLAQNGLREVVAVLVAAVAMLAIRSPVVAMMAAMATGAIWAALV